MATSHVFTQKVWQASAVRSLRHKLSAKRLYRSLTAQTRRLPDFLVAGAQKSGTTSLWAYLAEHPDVEPPMQKEMSFFDVNFHRGVDWYRKHFPRVSSGAVGTEKPNTLTGESTAYYMFHPLAAERIAKLLPDVKIIFVLRNPVDRAYSHYQLKVLRLQEHLSFEEAIDAEAERLEGEEEKIIRDPRYYSPAHDRHSYLARGRYFEQICRWQKLVPADRLLILESSGLFRQPQQVYDRTLAFLQLRGWQPAQFGNRFPGRYQEKMSEAMRRKLVEYFAPHNAKLYAHLGTRFNWDQ